MDLTFYIGPYIELDCKALFLLGYDFHRLLEEVFSEELCDGQGALITGEGNTLYLVPNQELDASYTVLGEYSELTPYPMESETIYSSIKALKESVEPKWSQLIPEECYCFRYGVVCGQWPEQD